MRTNLKIAGVTQPPSSAAHHLVASNAAGAANARGVLQRVGIDINEAGNGMFLPIDGKRMVPGVETHSSVHTQLYYNTVFERLSEAEAGGRQTVLNALSQIRTELLNGTFPVRAFN